MTTTYIDTFVEKLRNPDFFDYANGSTSASDVFLKQLGEIAKKIQTNALTTADAQSVKTTLAWFSDLVNRMNTQLAGVAPSVGSDSKFASAFKSLASQANLAFQQLSYVADEIIAGNSTSLQELSSKAAAVLKQAGALLGLAQIAIEVGSVSTTTDFEKVGEKSAGVLAGYAFGELTVAAVVVVGAAFSLPVVATAATALVLGVGVSYVAGKGFETLWPTASEYYRGLATNVFSTAIPQITNKIDDWTIKLGNFDGTWLEGLTGVSDADKATFSTLMAGVAKVPATAQLNADITKLFQAEFTGQALVARDLLLKTILSFAQENGYATERITTNAANVTLDLPSFPTSAAVSLREYVKSQLSPADQVGLSITGPNRIVVALAAGTHAASAQSSLLIGSSGVDGLIGGAGDDDLIGGAGQDILLGDAGTDDLFGGIDNDFLDGGAGGDYLYGGAGTDRYEFNGAFGSDKVVDSDSNGTLWVDAIQLTGGKKLSAELDIWESDNGFYRYTQMSGNLIITKGSKAGVDDMKGSITVQGWTAGQLGITLGTEVIETPPEDRNYTGDQRAPITVAGSTTYNWGVTTWAVNGTLTGGVQEAGFAGTALNVPNLGVNCLNLNTFKNNRALSHVFVIRVATINVAFNSPLACLSTALACNTRAVERACKHRRRRNGLVNLHRRSGVAIRRLSCEV